MITINFKFSGPEYAEDVQMVRNTVPGVGERVRFKGVWNTVMAVLHDLGTDTVEVRCQHFPQA